MTLHTCYIQYSTIIKAASPHQNWPWGLTVKQLLTTHIYVSHLAATSHGCCHLYSLKGESQAKLDERQKVLKGINQVGLIRRPSFRSPVFMSRVNSREVVLTEVQFCHVQNSGTKPHFPNADRVVVLPGANNAASEAAPLLPPCCPTVIDLFRHFGMRMC